MYMLIQEDLMNNIFNRTSIRHYLDKPIESEKMTLLLKAAMQAPSANNQQPWAFIIVDDRDLLDELSTISRGAWMLKDVKQAIVVVMTPTDKSPSMRVQDCAAATQNILLEATSLDLGACWIGVYSKEDRMKSVAKLLNIQGADPFAIIALGYPKEQKTQTSRFDPTRVHHNVYRK